MMSRSSDKEVLVVIGTGGMGLSIARRVGPGRVIVLADINQSGLEAAAEGLTADGHDVVTQQVDVTSRSSVASVADRAASMGRVTAVVHTAGCRRSKHRPTRFWPSTCSVSPSPSTSSVA
jgi:NAD(P)-dependent dehydrogenase (short-subunit alcohol dehydrogenase family)